MIAAEAFSRCRIITARLSGSISGAPIQREVCSLRLSSALKGHFQLHLHDGVFVVLHPAGHLLTAGQHQRFGGLDDRRVLEAYILRSVPWKVRLRLSTAWPDQ